MLIAEPRVSSNHLLRETPESAGDQPTGSSLGRRALPSQPAKGHREKEVTGGAQPSQEYVHSCPWQSPSLWVLVKGDS